MQIPSSVKIAGFVYKCDLVPNMCRDSSAQGNSCGNALQINIDSTLPQQNRESTLLHEILEQIDYRYELNLDHHKITTLETALYQVIKDNPDIFKP